MLAQDYGDFELLAINDGSTDNSGALIDAYDDPRLRVIHQANQGLALTLRRGVQMASGEYIARHDQDDVSAPSRFRQQVDWLDAHPDCGIVGTWSTIVEGRTPTARGHHHPTNNGRLQVMCLFDSYFVHSSVMLRRESVLLAGNYPADPARNPPEDFDLWSRLARVSSLANLPQQLLVYRELPGSISRAKADLIASRAHTISCENIAYTVGTVAGDQVVNDLVALVRCDRERVSEKPDTRTCAQLLDVISVRLIQRFPSDAAEILLTCAELQKKVVKSGRIERRLMGWMRPLTGQIRRFLR